MELQQSIEALMAAIEKVEPPHEAEGSVKFEELYAGKDFFDDISGMPSIARWPQRRERTKSSSLKVEESTQRFDARRG